MQKRCPKCKITKDIIHFTKDKKAKDGLSWQCRECKKQYDDKRRSNPIIRKHINTLAINRYYQNRERYKKYALRDYYKIKDFINTIKLGLGCKICGYNEHAEALVFHHRNPKEKEFNIGNVRVSRKRLLKEIAKCDVLCANCHRIITFNNKEN